jgi:polyribonucleotide nucleotidyltransferase
MGPIGAARVGYQTAIYPQPDAEQIKEGELDLVVAGTRDAVMMVESEAKELSEDVMLGGVMFAHRASQKVIDAIISLAEQAAKDPWELDAPTTVGRQAAARDLIGDDLAAPTSSPTSSSARPRSTSPRQGPRSARRLEPRPAAISGRSSSCKKLEAEIVRTAILKEGRRIDGRDTKTVRPIEAMVGFLPRTHGSALFTRGETQAIVTTTLGTKDAEQMIDGLNGLHYEHSCCTITSRPTRSAKSDASAPRGGAKSATASSPGGRSTRCCRPRTNSPTRSASSQTSPSPTAPRPWRPCAAARCR